MVLKSSIRVKTYLEMDVVTNCTRETAFKNELTKKYAISNNNVLA